MVHRSWSKSYLLLDAIEHLFNLFDNLINIISCKIYFQNLVSQVIFLQFHAWPQMKRHARLLNRNRFYSARSGSSLYPTSFTLHREKISRIWETSRDKGRSSNHSSLKTKIEKRYSQPVIFWRFPISVILYDTRFIGKKSRKTDGKRYDLCFVESE